MRNILFFAAALSCAAQSGRFELANDSVLLALDSAGNLAELTNRQTGHRYVAAAAQPPWRMYYRFGTPLDGALDLEIDPARQTAQVRRESGALVISYKTLVAEAPRRGTTREIQVGLEVRVALDGDRLVWTGRIANRETDPRLEITELWIPWIYGLGDLGLGRATDVLYWPERAGRRIQDPYAKISAAPAPTPRGESALRLTYPFPAGMQWFTFNNGEEGLYFGSHDKTLMTTCLNVMAHRDKALSASVVKYPFVKPGETWTSEPVVLRLYRGDWHAAAKTYRAWTDTWMERTKPPEWLRRMPGWVLPSFKGQSGHISAVYADLPSIFKEARAGGFLLLNCFGWVKQGFDNLYPEYDPDEALGGEQGLRAALAEVKRAGGHSILYTQGQLIDPSTEYYRKEGHRIVARDIWGYEYRESYGGTGQGTLLNVMRNKYFGVACPGAKGWIEHLEWQLGLVRGLGAQGIIFDQMGGIPPYICYSKDHPHAKPSLAVGPAKVQNMKRLRAVMKARDPEFAFVIELGTDCYAGLVDIIHSHGIGFWPEPEAFGEMLRYTFPEPLITNRGGGPYDRRMQLGHAFALGWRFDSNLRDTRDPALGPFLARLCALRGKYPDLLLDGRFVDNEGFLADNSRVSAHAFVAGNRMAVTLWNPGDAVERVNVIAPGYELEVGLDRSLAPKDATVLIFRRK
ncbi:MAG: hypothetical protein HY822_24880 [Acidobacteria bacterium]|nr:hypothetical protein [Acidobacteriota bacterium]